MNSTQPRPQRTKRQARFKALWLKAFVWTLLAVFLFGSLGIALIATR